MWRDNLERCIRLENEEVAKIRGLIASSHDPEKLRTYAESLAVKIEVITILNQLLMYSDRSES